MKTQSKITVAFAAGSGRGSGDKAVRELMVAATLLGFEGEDHHTIGTATKHVIPAEGNPGEKDHKKASAEFIFTPTEVEGATVTFQSVRTLTFRDLVEAVEKQLDQAQPKAAPKSSLRKVERAEEPPAEGEEEPDLQIA